MSVLKRIWKPKRAPAPAPDSASDMGPVESAVSARGRPSSSTLPFPGAGHPRRSRSVADGLVSLFVRERKHSTHSTLALSYAPVEFKAAQRVVRRIASDLSSSHSSDIRCPSELGEQRLSLGSDDYNDHHDDFDLLPPPPGFEKPASQPRQLPAELLAQIFRYVPRATLPVLASVNRVFRAESTRLLYLSVDLIGSGFDPAGSSVVEKGLRTLAESRELALLVRSFKYHIPRAHLPRRAPAPLNKLRTALRNLENLRSLHLENAPLNVLDGVPFLLNDLHVEFSFLYAEPKRSHDTTLLGTCLTRQSELRSLRLINCDALILGDSQGMPHLSEVAGSAAVASAIVPFRPVERVSITISKADEGRMTPSRLMAALSRSSAALHTLELNLTATDLPYEVFLTAAASRLQHLHTLVVTGTHRALELLFRHIHHILLPLSTLHTVRMMTLPQVPHNHEDEFQRVKIWYKLCPSLRLLQFPSRVEWFVTVDEQDLTPIVGKRVPENPHGLRRLRML
ncbi:hypothetical protein EXIGLDRAFT_753969 [Exidia glandulosa HHB12029]|uniref:F-box domain-containing protein n=1 Tax=Exidia glandulosa HHB12029 TaxID=1314781 RepID=A0A165DD29_EXIGL|nr:hypothetical protein EXIGLDRAFT_753969 [Exidia glandulosa HHB12029]